MDKRYLPLNEYSNKYRVSVSTLRRRIKSGDLEYEFSGGKYWIVDSPIGRSSRPAELNLMPQKISQEVKLKEASESSAVHLSTEKVLQELKGAYILILQEKEEQILVLREEVADLKTLVRILESENERLKSNLKESAPIDSWLAENLER